MTDDFGPPRKPGEKKDRRGAPKYTDALGREICGRIAAGQTLPQISALKHMPHKSTILAWAADDRMAVFRDRYLRARRASGQHYADLIRQEASAVTPENAHAKRVTIGAYQWLAAKLAPQEYGDRLDVNVAGRVEHVHAAKEAPEWLQERLKGHPKVIEGTAIPAPPRPRTAPKPDGTTTH